MAPWIGLRAPNAGGLGSIPGQGTCMPQLRVCMPQLRSLPATAKEPTCCNEGAGEPQLRSPSPATKTPCNQINN